MGSIDRNFNKKKPHYSIKYCYFICSIKLLRVNINSTLAVYHRYNSDLSTKVCCTCNKFQNRWSYYYYRFVCLKYRNSIYINFDHLYISVLSLIYIHLASEVFSYKRYKRILRKKIIKKCSTNIDCLKLHSKRSNINCKTVQM